MSTYAIHIARTLKRERERERKSLLQFRYLEMRSMKELAVVMAVVGPGIVRAYRTIAKEVAGEELLTLFQ